MQSQFPRSEENRPDPILIQLHGVVLRYRWPDTGEEFDVLVDFFPSFLSTVKRVLVFAMWKASRASPEEIYAVRKLCPDLSLKPVSQLISALSESNPYLLGEFSEGEAKELLEAGSRLKLQLFISDASLGSPPS